MKLPIYSENFVTNLKRIRITEISNSELRSLEQKPKARTELLRKLKAFCRKEFQMDFE